VRNLVPFRCHLAIGSHKKERDDGGKKRKNIEIANEKVTTRVNSEESGKSANIGGIENVLSVLWKGTGNLSRMPDRKKNERGKRGKKGT